jgi:hypothetical protein
MAAEFQERSGWADAATAAALGTALLFLGGDAGYSRPPQPAAAEYHPLGSLAVDCAKYPGSSASLLVDTLSASEADIGNVDADTGKWRERAIVLGLGAGEFALVADGFGPLLEYQDVASGALDEPVLTFRSTGSTVTAGMPFTGLGPGAAVQITFKCGPSAGG